MSYLLDTNVVSEWARPRPDPGVIAWLAALDEDETFISVITVAELTHGVERLPDGKRKDRLAVWLKERLTERFEDRILSVDVPTAAVWAQIRIQAQSLGQGIEPMDAFIAATAEQHDLTLVTRNTADFSYLGIRLFNPWQAEGAP